MTDGLFDDTAVIRRVVREGVLLAGGGCASILQIAHPGVAQGVADHSSYAERPLDRLKNTMQYVYGVVFGTEQEALLISRAVYGMHTRVTGPGYSANDPDLQVWVNATLFHTATRIYQEIFGPLTDVEADACYQQYAVLATSIGCPAQKWPENRREFAQYWNRTVASLVLSQAGQEIAHELLHPRNLPLALRSASPVNRFVTVGLLPDHVRRQLGRPWSPRKEQILRAGLRAGSVIYPRLPLAVRQAPKTYYLGALRKQVARRRPATPVS